MPTQVSNYQCPACTGPLHYDGISGKLKCDYCGKPYDPEEIEKLYSQKENQWDDSALNTTWENENMKAYSCPSCGAELICEETTAASSCPYCGNPSIIPGQFKGTLKPDYVIPFKLAKKQAEENLKKHYRRKPFLPSAFTRSAHIEKIQGVYVPFWMFDGTAEGNMTFQAEKRRIYTRGDQKITETRHYQIYREGSLSFEKVPVDASLKMDDAYMDSIEPYNYKDLVSFSTAYLPGYLADKYDVTVRESEKRADKRCSNTLKDAFSKTVQGYTSFRPVSENIHIHKGKVHYGLFPIWILHTKWNGTDYLFMMNGQTGKMAGDLPVSKVKATGTFTMITVVLTAIISLFYYL